MKTLFKIAAAATLTGALALAGVTPSQARDGRNAAAAIGFGAGALVGAAAASANNGYYGPGYAYAPGPGYYADDYAYEPAPVYVDPAPGYYYSGRYQRNRQSCGQSPGSMNYTSCN
jgi:hypothetical protein